MSRPVSESLYSKAKKLFPGGVNSPVRAFKAVSGSPVFIESGKGSTIRDVDGKEYIDFCCSFGPLILGHAPDEVVKAISEAAAKGTSFGAPTRQENELAELILDNHSYLDKIRFVNSGTEAVMSAIRLARGVTGRDKVVKFEGCYHGHVDSLLVEAGSGLATLGTSSSAGVPEAYTAETIVLPLHDEEAVETAVKKYAGDIACIIIEPVPANNGLLIQGVEYLQYLRDVCDREGILLIFDEVISGFRIGFEGAAGHYGIAPDILTFGKIIGGGMPVGAYGASNEIMGHVAPEGDVYQAGTLSGNPVAMAAGKAQIEACLQPGFYEELERKAAAMVDSINDYAAEKGHAFKIFRLGSIFWPSFSNRSEVSSSAEIAEDSGEKFKKFHAALLESGIYLGPSGYEVGFVSRAHSESDLERAATAIKDALEEL